MKKKRFRKTKRFFKILLLLIIGGIIYSFAFSTYENIKVDQNIKAFKERAKTEDMYEVVLDYSQYNTNKAHIRRCWPVPRETSFLKCDPRITGRGFLCAALGLAFGPGSIRCAHQANKLSWPFG